MWLLVLAIASVPLTVAALGMTVVAGWQGGFRRRGVAWLLWGTLLLVCLAIAGIGLSFGFDLDLALLAPLAGAPLAFLMSMAALSAMNLHRIARALGGLFRTTRRLEARARTLDRKALALRLGTFLLAAARLSLEVVATLGVVILKAGFESLGEESEEPVPQTIRIPVTQWGEWYDDGSGNYVEFKVPMI